MLRADHARKILKIAHTIAACGIIGGLVCYMVILLYAPQDTALRYADIRQTIDTLCRYVLLPSLAIALISGLLSMAVHRPFQDTMWAWIKALLGIGMFEGTLAIVHAKADTAARLSLKIAEATGDTAALNDSLSAAIASEWTTLWAILALSVANVVLGVWRPSFRRRSASPRTGSRINLGP
jgi:hypothetical protein